MYTVVTALYFDIALPGVSAFSYLFGESSVRALTLGSVYVFFASVLRVMLYMPFGKYGAPILNALCALSQANSLLEQAYPSFYAGTPYDQARKHAVVALVLFVLCFIPYRIYKKRVDPPKP